MRSFNTTLVPSEGGEGWETVIKNHHKQDVDLNQSLDLNQGLELQPWRGLWRYPQIKTD